MKPALIMLLFLAPTIQYRVELGAFSFTLMEPVVLITVAALLVDQISREGRLVVLKSPLVFLCLGMTIWAFMIRPWSSDWKHGLSDMRDWAIPVLGFVTLTGTVRDGWRRWIGFFTALALCNALLGLYQHVTDSFRPFIGELAAYKTGFAVSPETNQLALVSYAVGFFSHPNGFAVYLFISLMLALGMLAQGGRRWLKIILVLCLGIVLFWTYAKASILVVALAVIVFALERIIKSGKMFLLLLAALLLLSVLSILVAVWFVPSTLLNTFYWRVGLWQTALEVVASHPSIILVGNGMDVFVTAAYYPQPHNLYIYLFLEYGLLGLLFGMIVCWSMWRHGWQARRAGLMAREPLLSALWIALLGYFAIGWVESSLIGIESRMIFLLAAACFVGLMREVRAAGAVEVESNPYVAAAIARPLSL
jgi:O-antigen ligase